MSSLKPVKCDTCKSKLQAYYYHSLSRDQFFDFCDDNCFILWAEKHKKLLRDDKEAKEGAEDVQSEDDKDYCADQEEAWEALLKMVKSGKIQNNYTQVILKLKELDAPCEAYKELRELLVEKDKQQVVETVHDEKEVIQLCKEFDNEEEVEEEEPSASSSDSSISGPYSQEKSEEGSPAPAYQEITDGVIDLTISTDG